MTTPVPAGRVAPHRLALAAVVALYLAAAGWHVLHGALNPDEGFYAIATRSVAQGEMPYRDFGFTQPPLTAHVNSLPLRFIGFGLFEQRAVNGLWAALAVALAAGWLWRHVSPWTAISLMAGCAISAPWLYFMHLGKTYALTGLLVMVATSVFLGMKAGPGRLFTLGLLALLGPGTRLPAAPFFFLLWGCACWPGRRPTAREMIAAGAGVLAGGLVVVLPFAVAAPEQAWFWVFEFHRVSVPHKTWRLAWQEIATLSPAAWGLVALVLFTAGRRWRELPRESVLLLVSLVALGCNLLPGGVYEEYGVPFLLPIATSALAMLHRAVAAWPRARLILLGLLPVAAQLLAAPVLYHERLPDRRGTTSMWLPLNAPPYNRELPAQLAGARRVVEALLPADAPLLGPHLILAAETGRPVPPEFRMGPFSLTGEKSVEQAARLRLATAAGLHALLADPATAVFAGFKRPALNYAWTVPSFGYLPDRDLKLTAGLLRENFVIAYDEGGFLILARRNRVP